MTTIQARLWNSKLCDFFTRLPNPAPGRSRSALL
uniref:Uncharacterized protein n=1 Tax=Anguilla anguilla TaxID=7936 RepID=A0A0E9TD00_ANGAN